MWASVIWFAKSITFMFIQIGAKIKEVDIVWSSRAYRNIKEMAQLPAPMSKKLVELSL